MNCGLWVGFISDSIVCSRKVNIVGIAERNTKLTVSRKMVLSRPELSGQIISLLRSTATLVNIRNKAVKCYEVTFAFFFQRIVILVECSGCLNFLRLITAGIEYSNKTVASIESTAVN